jgi:tetratricopeptide (TPR) repeat protein
MKPDQIFHLIQNLTKDERLGFSKYMYGKKKSYTFIIYNRFLKASVLTDDSLEKIKGREFSDSSMFYIYREKVSVAVIESLVQSKKLAFPTVQFIKEAFVRGMSELAFNRLCLEIKRLENQEEYESLDVIHSLIENLRGNYSITVCLPDSLLSVNEVRTRVIRNRTLKSSLESTKGVLSKPDDEIQRLVDSIRFVARREYQSKANQILAAKLNRNIEFLKNNPESAFAWGEKVVQLMKKNLPDYSLSVIAKELRVIAMNAAFLNEREVATRYCMEIAMLNVSNKHEHNEVVKSLVKIKTAIAIRLVDPEIAGQSLLELEKNSDIFSNPNLKAKLLHTIGLTYFASGDFENADECFRKVRIIVLRSEKLLQWEPQLLMAISRLEGLKGDDIDDLLRSAQRFADQNTLHYPHLAIDIIRKAYNQPAADHRLIYSDGLKKINKLLSIPDEEKVSRTIQLENWIAGKVQRIPQKQIMLRRNEETKTVVVLDDFA